MSGFIEFPQPMVEAPEVGTRYWLVDTYGNVADIRWEADHFDLMCLALGNAYATGVGACQRATYNRQENARLVIPSWFRKLGPDVEFQWAPGKWETVDLSGRDWSQERPENYRARARDVVRTVEGKEYRWPATVKEGEPAGGRYKVTFAGVLSYYHANMYGPSIHHTREGADQQFASIEAAAGL